MPKIEKLKIYTYHKDKVFQYHCDDGRIFVTSARQLILEHRSKINELIDRINQLEKKLSKGPTQSDPEDFYGPGGRGVSG